MASADISAHILASSKSSADISKLEQFQYYPRLVNVYGGSHLELNNLSTNVKESEGSKDGREERGKLHNSNSFNLNSSDCKSGNAVFGTNQ